MIQAGFTKQEPTGRRHRWQNIFATHDLGDGALNLEEFSKLVTSPKLSFWMSRLAEAITLAPFSVLFS